MNWALNVTQIRPRQLVRRRPRRQNVGLCITALQEFCGVPVQKDVIAIREIVFKSEAVGRIYKPGANETQCDYGDRGLPIWHATPQRGNAQNDFQRNYRQKIAGQFCAANYGHCDEVSSDYCREYELYGDIDSLALAVCIDLGREEHR